MRHPGIIAASILLGAICGILVGVQSPRVEHNLRGRLIAWARTKNLIVEIEHLQLDLFPPGLSVSGVVARSVERDRDWVRLHRGTVRLRPWPSPTGALVVDRLELDGFEWDQTMGPRREQEVAPGTGWPWGQSPGVPFDIRELLVWNGRVLVELGDHGKLSLSPFDVSMLPNGQGAREIRADIAHGSFAGQGASIGFETKLHATLQGSLDRPELFTLDRAGVFLPELAVTARGRWPFAASANPEGEGMSMTLEGDASLEALRWLLPDDVPALSGLARVKVELLPRETEERVFGLEVPRVRVEAAVQETQIAGESLGDVKLQAMLEGRELSVESFEVHEGSLGRVTGSGTLDLVSRNLTLTARVHQLKLQEVLSRAGLPEAWVRTDISGDLQGSGALSPFRLDARVDLITSDFAVLNQSYRHPEAETMLALPRARVMGKTRVTSRAVELLGVQVSRGSTELNVQGTLSLNPALGLDLKVSGESVDLSDVGPIAGLPFAGTGTLFAALEGPYNELTISGTPDLAGLQVGGYALGATKATVIFENLRLSVDRGVVRRGRGQLWGQGFIDFAPAEPQVGASVHFKRLALGDALKDLGLSPAIVRNVGGEAEGLVVINGSLAHPDGVINVAASDATFEGVPLGTLRGRVELGGDGPYPLALELTGAPGGGAVTTELAFAPGPQGLLMKLRGELRRVPLEVMAPLFGDGSMGGFLSGGLELQGPAERLGGSFRADIAALSVVGVRAGGVQLDGQLAEGNIDFRGEGLGGRVSATGSLSLGERLPLQARLAFRGVRVEDLVELPAEVSVQVTGSVDVGVELQRLESLSADIALQEATVRLRDYRMQLARPARGVIRHDHLQVKDLALSGPNLGLRVEGGLGVRTGLLVDLAGTGDVAIVTPWLPSLQRADGPFSVQARISGTLEAPLIDGQGNLSEVTLRVQGLSQDLEDLEADFEFSGRNVEILNGRARAGGGHIAFNGAVILPVKDVRPQLRLYGRLSEVTLRPNRQTTLTGSGTLQVAGPLGDLLLSGQIELTSARYTRELELTIESFFPRRDAPLQVPDFAPGQTVTVDVHVEAPRNIRLDAGAVQGEFRASLDFRGTTESLGLIGTVTPLWARARYRDLVFEYESGDITFTEDFRLFAKYDLLATAEGCGMAMTLGLNGDSQGRYTIELSGEDQNGPVHEQDPWSCVTYGVRLSEFGGETALSKATSSERATLQETLGSGLDLLWGVSGLDAKVKKILPYVDEARITLGRSGRRGNLRLAPRLVMRKDVGNKVQLKYNGSLDEFDDQIVSLEYQLSKVATLEGSWVSISDVPIGDFGLDLRLQWEFD